jgi:hypothetical protein
MHSIPRLFTLFALLWPMSVLAQQEKPLRAQLRVRWDGFNIVVIKDGEKHPLNVARECSAATLDSVKLLSAKASGDFTYLLFDVKGQSRTSHTPEEASTQCGVGEERSLIWMKLDAGWRKVDSQSFVIESCWDTATLEDEGAPITFNGPDLVARGTTARDPKLENTIENYKRRKYEVRYSLKHPENGLQVSLVLDKHR